MCIQLNQSEFIRKSNLPILENFCEQKSRTQVSMQKLLKAGRLLFLIIPVCSVFFAIESCKKFRQTELIKKSNCLDINGHQRRIVNLETKKLLLKVANVFLRLLSNF